MYTVIALMLMMFQTDDIEPTFVVNGISVSDVDIGDGDMKMSFNVTKGTLSLAQTTNLVFITGDGVDDAAIVFTGKIADVNLAISSIRYYANVNASGVDTLKIIADDQGNTGAGGPKTATASIPITIPAVNMTPIVVAPQAQRTNEDTALNILGIKITDADAGSNPIKVTMSVNHGTISLKSVARLTFENGDGVDDSAMTFIGTLVDIGTAVSSVKYVPALNFTGEDTLTITANDQGFSGEGGAKVATTLLSITITAINDLPILTTPATIK